MPVAELRELPPPALSRVGWPWSEASPLLPACLPDGQPWPSITVVTPSLNQGAFLEETIRSVLLQGYPNLDYVVLDGGSSDNSLAILQKYGPWLSWWRSSADPGQASAIHEGISRSRSSLVAWLNSDDAYLPGALAHVAELAHAHPGALILAAVREVDRDGVLEQMVLQRGLRLRQLVRFWEEGYSWHQPGLFTPRTAYEGAGGLDTNLHLVFDHDLLCRLLSLAPLVISERPVACFRKHPLSKSSLRRVGFLIEQSRVAPRYWNWLPREDRRGCRTALVWLLLRRAIGEFVGARPSDAALLLRASVALVVDGLAR